MNPLNWIGLGWVKMTLIASALVVAATGLSWFVHHQRDVGREEIRAQWNAERVQLQAAVQAQQMRNLDLQRAAEKHYIVAAEVRERFIVQTVKEIRYATANLAACPVTAAARGLLQHAADCASGDSPAACGPDQPLRAASAAR